jgi:hypothetical protein
MIMKHLYTGIAAVAIALAATVGSTSAANAEIIGGEPISPECREAFEQSIGLGHECESNLLDKNSKKEDDKNGEKEESSSPRHPAEDQLMEGTDRLNDALKVPLDALRYYMDEVVPRIVAEED